MDSIADCPILPIPHAAANAAIAAPIAPATGPHEMVAACNKIVDSNIILWFLVYCFLLSDPSLMLRMTGCNAQDDRL